MIVCRLELWPGGVEEGAELLGEIHFTNDLMRTLRSDGTRGDYKVHLYKKRKKLAAMFRVRNYPRQSYHPWELVRRALNRAHEMGQV